MKNSTLEHVWICQNHDRDSGANAKVSLLSLKRDRRCSGLGILQCKLSKHRRPQFQKASINTDQKWLWINTLYPCSSDQNSWDLWMFIPLKMVLIGIDPYPNGKQWPHNFYGLSRATHLKTPPSSRALSPGCSNCYVLTVMTKYGCASEKETAIQWKQI